MHVDSLKQVVANNPDTKVITNSGVGKILDAEGISYSLMEGRDSSDVGGVIIEAFDNKHEEIFEEVGQVQNTGYFIGEKLFYPGDSYCDPEKNVEILALPVAGPWCKVPDAIRYALEVKPKTVFPVHDGMLDKNRIGSSHKIPEKVLKENGIDFIVMNEGDEKEF